MPGIREDAPERIDEYIGKAAAFARPICRRLRELIHEADAGIVEDWKWGPNFHKAGMVCMVGAFKRHVSLHFFHDAADDKGSRSIRFAKAEEIDPEAVVAYVREAVALNESGAKVPAKKPVAKVPEDLERALAADGAAKEFFDGLTPGYRREYVDWVESAKREATRERRVAGAVERCARGETLNEKYRRNC